jgi:hypothetical protein
MIRKLQLQSPDTINQDQFDPIALRSHLIKRLLSNTLIPGSDEMLIDATLRLAALNNPSLILSLAAKLATTPEQSNQNNQRIPAPIILNIAQHQHQSNTPTKTTNISPAKPVETIITLDSNVDINTLATIEH